MISSLLDTNESKPNIALYFTGNVLPYRENSLDMTIFSFLSLKRKLLASLNFIHFLLFDKNFIINA